MQLLEGSGLIGGAPTAYDTQVVLVAHETTGRSMALKVLNKRRVRAMQQTRNVIVEKQILGSLHHPHILTLYQTYVDNDNVYMLLELLPGGDLWTVRNASGQKHSRSVVLKPVCL